MFYSRGHDSSYRCGLRDSSVLPHPRSNYVIINRYRETTTRENKSTLQSKTLTSQGFHSPKRTLRFSVPSRSLTLVKQSNTGCCFLSPPRMTTFSLLSHSLVTYSKSFSRNSSSIISKSRIGLMSPSTCEISSLSNTPGVHFRGTR